MGQRVVIQWGISSYFGWGVYGLNLALAWSSDPQIEALCATDIVPEQIAVDALRWQALAPFFARSVQFQEELRQFANGTATAAVTVLVGMGNDLMSIPAAHNVALAGTPSIGVVFFEQPLEPDAVERGKRFPLIVTGSTWNERVLRSYGIERVRTVLQGIDPSHFHSAPKLRLLPQRFLVFSGGKPELRKGQDIVLAAFKVFAERHPEAVLATAWHSPWPQVASTLDVTGIAAPAVFKQASGELDVTGWAQANGIRTDQLLDLGNVPNLFLPALLREMDVAVFANRAEGGTNLVAMECMACGVPVILSRNTGHLDLIVGRNCYTIDDQRQAPGSWTGVGEVPGWGESQVDEVIERLEEVFSDRAEAARRGARGAETLARLTWAETARQMKQIVLELA